MQRASNSGESSEEKCCASTHLCSRCLWHYGQRIKAREKKRNRNKNCRGPTEWNRERKKTDRKTINHRDRIRVKVELQTQKVQAEKDCIITHFYSSVFPSTVLTSWVSVELPPLLDQLFKFHSLIRIQNQYMTITQWNPLPGKHYLCSSSS